MAAKKKPFTKFQCSTCKKINYFIKKSKAAGETKLERSKFCNACRKHTAHKEAKR